MKPVLAQAIDSDALMRLAHDDQWVFARKLDGQRQMFEIVDGKLTVYNRSGVVRAAPDRSYVLFMKSYFKTGRWVLDGELLRDLNHPPRYIVFDLPVAGQVVGPNTPFVDRLAALEQVSKLCKWGDNVMMGHLVYAKTTEEKLSLLKMLMEANAEGVVARKLTARYEEGRRSHDVLKFKFVKTADCIVVDMGREGKDNMTLAVYRDGDLVEVGNCTALNGDGPLVKVGDVVEVSYLSVSADGRLIQPTKPKLRIDKVRDDCDFGQLVPITKF